MRRQSKPSQETDPFAGLTLEDLDKVAPGPVAQSHVGQVSMDEFPDVIGDPRPLPALTPEQIDAFMVRLTSDLQADLKLAQAQRDGSNRRIEELMDELQHTIEAREHFRERCETADMNLAALSDELAAKDKRIEELEAQVVPECLRDTVLDPALPARLGTALDRAMHPQADLQEREETQEGAQPLPYPPYLAQDVQKHPDCSPFPHDQAVQDAENARTALGLPLLRHPFTHESREDATTRALLAKVSQDAETPAIPIPAGSIAPDIAQMRRETSCAGSDAAMLAVTVTSLQAELETAHNEIGRLIRRIEELGGKPPKRDRAAYMRNYRTRTKKILAGADPDRLVRFLHGADE